MPLSRIEDAISEYAAAYRRLEDLQRQGGPLQIGDQKTGVIGEYYVYRYLQRKYPSASLRYGTHSEKGWDIEVSEDRKKVQFQVKTVSAYSRTRGLSPIHSGNYFLYVVSLNAEFCPDGFWLVRLAEYGDGTVMSGVKCPRPGVCGHISRGIRFGECLLPELAFLIAE